MHHSGDRGSVQIMPKLVKVLSNDGGGIRGIVPASVLAEIERRTKRPVAKLFDLVAGTSTGGIHS
jgi:patatin-like phospholipase/acyl hydrolase